MLREQNAKESRLLRDRGLEVEKQLEMKIEPRKKESELNQQELVVDQT